MRIAVLSDDPLVPVTVRGALEHHLRHACHVYSSVAGLLKSARQKTFDLLIADWHLCGADGIEVMQRMRDVRGQHLPILLAVRRGDELGLVQALRHGVVDFVVQPLRAAELVARTSALLQRAYPEAMDEQLRFDPYRFDPEKRQLFLHETPLALKNREYELALFLFRNAGRLLSRAHLREVVWGESDEVPSRSLDTHVSRIRTKLQLTKDNGFTITAVYGMGYRLDPPESQ